MWYKLAQGSIGGGIISSPNLQEEEVILPQIISLLDQMKISLNAYRKLSEQQRNELLSLLQVAPISSDPLTLEEQLESAREDDPVFQSMGSTENIRGEMLIRGIPQYNVGKGADMFQDLPSNITTN
jgi:predicted HTH domain antitoxin